MEIKLIYFSCCVACVKDFVSLVAVGFAEEFSITVTATGIFNFKEGTAKEVLHVETYNDMFPHMRAFVTTLTSNTGIPPIIIPFIDISKQEIYRFEMGKNGQMPNPDDFINPHDKQ